ncbi:NADH-quinone oxidoreductase subunit C [Deferrisoma camini]|uniref:NADH-quinone oxidoreductase subunit C n=1 Tax=Deferrisoma camini TaxID=1035120 RepID=UPI0004A4F5BE|nr:NADH-quinone oxidoreductase subunit C [Deferrisoma camini]
MSDLNAIVDILKGEFGDAVLGHHEFRGQTSVVVAKDRIADVATFCRDDGRLGFNMLTDLTAVDRTPRTPRFEVIYNLYSFPHNRRLRLKAPVEENDTIPTVEGVWKAANWLEREVYDLFGIVFDGHSDLRRILLWDGYVGHPLRKDYPLEGIPQKVVYR